MKKKIIGCITVILLVLCAVMINLAKGKTEKGRLCISEVMTANGSFANAEGAYHDWIEFYYEGNETLDLSGYYLSDDKNDIYRWRFPEIMISPGEYLVIFASGEDLVTEQGEIHTNFKLDAMGEQIYVSDENGKFVAGLEIPEMKFDQSYGRTESLDKNKEAIYTVFSTGSPNGKNLQEIAPLTKETKAVEYALPAGVYGEDIFLELSTSEKEAEIYYTLDGSEPTKDSLKYEGECLNIGDRTQEENRYTGIWSSPYDWEGDGNFSYNPNPQYKATVVKTRLYFPKEDCWSDKIWTNTYLIGADYTLPVVSLSIEDGKLFDPETGICVPGKAYSEYLKTAKEINPEPRKRIGNYSSDKKVSAYLEYFETNGSKVMEQEITMRVCGNISRGSGMKSFAVYAWGDEQTGVFSYPIFGEDCRNLKGEVMKTFTSLRLRNFGNDWRRSKFRDILGQRLAEDLKLGGQAYQPAIVLINGEYYGLCEIRENRDEKYYEERFEIPSEQLREVKVSELYDTKETEEEKEFLRLLSYMEENDLSLSEPAAFVESKFDVKQFLDYVLLQLYLGNLDWHNNNCGFYKSATVKEGAEYADGKWRVLLYDLDYSINYQTEDHYTLLYEANTHNSRILRALLANEEWKSYYVDRFEELLEKNFQPGKAIALQQALQAQIEEEISEDLSRWDVYLEGQVLKETTKEYWYEKMEDLKNFFLERPEYAKKYFYDSLDRFFGK